MKICDGSAARWILAALVFSTLCQPVHVIENRRAIPGYVSICNDVVRVNAILNDVYELNPGVCQSNPIKIRLH